VDCLHLLPALGLGFRSFIKNIKYPFQHPRATVGSLRGLSTGTKVYPTVRAPFKLVGALDTVKSTGRISGTVPAKDVMKSVKYEGPSATYSEIWGKGC